MFVDKVGVLITAGRGGNGAVSFRHEKYIDKGGPDGGDGGNGGDVVLVGSTRTNTLAAFRYQKEINAADGNPGSKRKKHGRSAHHLEVMVPVGTAVYRDGQLIADIVSEGQKEVVAKGGKGGFGNAHFTSSRRQTPRVAEMGEPGETFEAEFELKLIAEVGLIGLPNAGKSTLLSVITNAKPEIANYAFTTIRPNLGVAEITKDKSILVADIPGLIAGASEGKGLGDEFLRHVERTKVLIHLIDSYSEDIEDAYKTIRHELAAYKVDLSKRPEIVVLSKIDGLDKDIIQDQASKITKLAGKKTTVMQISSKSGVGIKELLFKALEYVEKEKEVELSKRETELPVISLPEDNEDFWHIEKTKKGYCVTGKKIERFALRTDFDNPAGVERLRDIMRKLGILHELERRGIDVDETIEFGENGALGKIRY